MKRIVLFILTGFFSVNLISQENSLYDVNYDQPEKSIVFSESELHYQQEYLQYEESLKLLTDEIRNEEKQNQIKAIEKLKKELEEDKINAIAEAVTKAKEDFYSVEFPKYQKEETARLTLELKQNLEKEYSEKLEQLKKLEFDRLEKELRATISLENEDLKKTYKQEVRNNLESEYEKQKNDELVVLQKNFEKKRNGELLEENKKRLEIERQKQISLLEKEFNTWKENEISSIEEKIKKEVSLENENLKKNYKDEVTQELESIYIEKKNSEIENITHELEKTIYEKYEFENDRIKYISYAFIVLIFLLVVLLLIFLLYKIISNKITNDSEIEDKVSKFINLLENEVGGNKELIIKDIEKESSNMKSRSKAAVYRRQCKKALDIAYESYKNSPKPIEDYKDELGGLIEKINEELKNWNINSRSEGYLKGVCQTLGEIRDECSKLGAEISDSCRFRKRDEIITIKNQIFEVYPEIFNRVATDLSNKIKSEDKDYRDININKQLTDRVEWYSKLSKEYEKIAKRIK